jgi:nicotinamidase-related amidase
MAPAEFNLRHHPGGHSMTTALLIVDVQQGMFMLKRPPHQGDEVVGRIAALLTDARASHKPIFHIRHNGGPGHILEPNTAGWAFHPKVTPQEGEPVIDKRHSSAFQKTLLDEHLKQSGVDTVVITGLQTEYCVDSACRAAFALGYCVVLASDAHTTFATTVLPAARIIVHHNLTLGDGFAVLATTDELRREFANPGGASPAARSPV